MRSVVPDSIDYLPRRVRVLEKRVLQLDPVVHLRNRHLPHGCAVESFDDERFVGLGGLAKRVYVFDFGRKAGWLGHRHRRRGLRDTGC
jgi:hypothetical protein